MNVTAMAKEKSAPGGRDVHPKTRMGYGMSAVKRTVAKRCIKAVLDKVADLGDRLKAAVDVVGISNFVTFLENTQGYRRDLRRVEYGDERDPAMRAHLQKISPLTNADKIRVPLFVVQGQNDPRVPVTEAEQVVKAVRAQGQKVWYMNALNEGHGYRKKENADVYAQAVVLFLKTHL